MTDNTIPEVYNRGVSGTISGFTTLDTTYGTTNVSIASLMEAIKNIEKTYIENYNPATLRTLLLDHISDSNNPHHDTFASLGVDVSTELIGSILPGTVPATSPSYSFDPLCLLPNTSFPVADTSISYTPDLETVTDTLSDSDNLYWMSEDRTVVSLKNYLDSANEYGYGFTPTISIGTSFPALLNKKSMSHFPVLDSSTITHDPYTTVNNNIWTVNTTDQTIKLLPTLNIPVTTDNTDLEEVTLLWSTLSNMVLGNNSFVYVIFTTAANDKLVVKYTNNNSYPTTIEVVYKCGYIEPVFLTEYTLGGVRFSGKAGDLLTVNWTITGTPDWSDYTDSDIKFSGGDVTHNLPDLYPLKYLLGNPNFLIGYTSSGSVYNPIGLLLNTPSAKTSTTSLRWKLPALSEVKNIGIFSLTVCVDNSVLKDSDPVPIFKSDHLTLSLSIHDNGSDPVSVWYIAANDGTNSTSLTLGGDGGYLQSIALSFDGNSLRVKCSGSSSTTQVVSNVNLNDLPNSELCDFDGAIVNIETYSCTDSSGTLDFLVGDTAHE